MQTSHFYTLRCLSNLHVGSGDNDYGVIDKCVQRDVNHGQPTIHASSLKGALREFLAKGAFAERREDLNNLFGAEDRAGSCRFLDAALLSRPLRSDKTAYLHASSPALLARLARQLDALGIPAPAGLNDLLALRPEEGKPLAFDAGLAGATVEEPQWQAVPAALALSDALKSLLGANLVLLHDADLGEAALPVLARNQLNDGQSVNLWYEEFVPWDALFGLFVIGEKADLDSLSAVLDGQVVQVGANASVGYGLCHLHLHSHQTAPAHA